MTYLLWHDLAANARRQPDRPAVAFENVVLTYRELDQASTRLAGVLRAHGIGRGDRVGILMPKSERAVVALLGASKSGAAYVPVDPQAPIARSGFILGDCAVSALITTTQKLRAAADALAGLASLRLVVLTDDGERTNVGVPGRPLVTWSDIARASPDSALPADGIETDPAYLLYTSGSTGNPKGVILSHRHALTFVDWGAETFAVTPTDRLSNHAPLHFDLSVFDLYVALRAGACVVIVPDSVAPFPVVLAQWINERGITIWYSVPSALIRLLLHGHLERFTAERLRTVLFAGEVFPVKYLRDLMGRWPHVGFHNLYGPTETNVCTYYSVPSPLQDAVTEIPIGRACANTDVFALDDQGRRVQAGATGELYVRGPALLNGYWGQPEKTGASMPANPLQRAYHEPVYRTGDVVRLDAEGYYWFIGRRDHLVKSRGYRIELGEVEQALYAHAGVREAAVVAIPDEEVGARLHAVVVGNGPDVTAGALHTFCLTRLPRYMVPETIELIDVLPKTSTGKVDRVALAERFTTLRLQDGGR